MNVLAREYCDDIKRKNKPIILSHRMMPGLLEGQEKARAHKKKGRDRERGRRERGERGESEREGAHLRLIACAEISATAASPTPTAKT